MKLKQSERLTRIADRLRDKVRNDDFDINHVCGTAVCVCGWAEKWGWNHWLEDLPWKEWKRICMPTTYKNPTKEAAILRIRALARKYKAQGK